VESILRKFLKVLYFREDGVYPRIGLPQQLLLQRFEFNSCLERVERLEEHRIPFVLRNDNPPNLPQARPIDNFWALLSGRVYNNGWKAQNEQQLRRRIMQKIREVDLVSVQNLMRYIKRKLRAIEDHGPLAIIQYNFYVKKYCCYHLFLLHLK
jgi:hypothetical protein